MELWKFGNGVNDDRQIDKYIGTDRWSGIPQGAPLMSKETHRSQLGLENSLIIKLIYTITAAKHTREQWISFSTGIKLRTAGGIQV